MTVDMWPRRTAAASGCDPDLTFTAFYFRLSIDTDRVEYEYEKESQIRISIQIFTQFTKYIIFIN
jgi:hypothetical protein